MRMIGHHDRSMENISLTVVMGAMLKNNVADIRRKRVAVQLTKCHKDRAVGLLVMWQAAAIIVIANWQRHS